MLKWKKQVIAAEIGEIRERVFYLEGLVKQATREMAYDAEAERLMRSLLQVSGDLDELMPNVTRIREDQ